MVQKALSHGPGRNSQSKGWVDREPDTCRLFGDPSKVLFKAPSSNREDVDSINTLTLTLSGHGFQGSTCLLKGPDKAPFPPYLLQFSTTATLRARCHPPECTWLVQIRRVSSLSCARASCDHSTIPVAATLRIRELLHNILAFLPHWSLPNAALVDWWFYDVSRPLYMKQRAIARKLSLRATPRVKLTDSRPFVKRLTKDPSLPGECCNSTSLPAYSLTRGL